MNVIVKQICCFRDEKKIGEGTKWRIVENPPPVYERKSRRGGYFLAIMQFYAF
jgi:hypothetical protein